MSSSESTFSDNESSFSFSSLDRIPTTSQSQQIDQHLNSPNWENLPPEDLVYIFSFVANTKFQFNVLLVSRHFNQVGRVIFDPTKYQRYHPIEQKNFKRRKIFALEWATVAEKVECVHYLVQDERVQRFLVEAGIRVLLAACQTGNWDIFEALVVHCKLQPQNVEPLVVACKYNHLEIVKYLCTQTEIDPGQSNVLYIAKLYQHHGIEDFLKRDGRAQDSGPPLQMDNRWFCQIVLGLVCVLCVVGGVVLASVSKPLGLT